MKLFSCVSFITLQIVGFFHQLVLILIFYGVTVKTKNWVEEYRPLYRGPYDIGARYTGVPLYKIPEIPEGILL